MGRGAPYQGPTTTALTRSLTPVMRPAMLRLTVQVPGSPGDNTQRLKHPRQVTGRAARGGLGNGSGARQSWRNGGLSDIIAFSFAFLIRCSIKVIVPCPAVKVNNGRGAAETA